MLTIYQRPSMEFDSGTLLRAGNAKDEADEATQSCTVQTTSSAWGEQQLSNLNKRSLSNALTITSPALNEETFVLAKKIKTEPKDDYALAEEECARNASNFTLTQEFPANSRDNWQLRTSSASPVYDQIPSFVDNCNRCVINQLPEQDHDTISLHRRRQNRAFEQSGEEPLSNKIRVWKERRLEKSLIRGKPTSRLEEEAFYAEFKNRGEQYDADVLRHHLATTSRHGSSTAEEENGVEGEEPNSGYLRYLLTRGNNSNSPGSGEDSLLVEHQGMPVVTEVNSVSAAALPNRESFEGPGSETVGTPRRESTETITSAAKGNKATRKRVRGSLVTGEYINEKSEALMAGNNKKSGKEKQVQNGGESMETCQAPPAGELNEANGTITGDKAMPESWGQKEATEQYISDIQRPYCNIPDDHQVTHINGVMSLPATRETRYGITLGELKRRTGYPEFLTRVDLIAYVRQSKSAGRALLDKYNIATAGQKSRPTILSKMCENEARVLGDGISRMNGEYFPWKSLARVASNKVTEGKANEQKLENKIMAIQNTRSMLKELYDLMVENKEIPSMKTFEIASHTFGTANILNHLTVFDRLFEEYQNNLLFRRDVRNNRKM